MAPPAVVVSNVLAALRQRGWALLQNVPSAADSDLILSLADIGRPRLDHVHTKSSHVYEVPIVRPNLVGIRTVPQSVLLHTDDSQHSDPARLVALQCVRQSPEGGETILLDADRLAAEAVATLTPATAEVVLGAPFPFLQPAGSCVEVKWHPILERSAVGWRVRYHPKYIQDALRRGHGNAELVAVFAQLLAVIEASTLTVIRLEPGEVFLFDNSRLLHGRTEFRGTDRLMRRVKLDASPSVAGVLR